MGKIKGIVTEEGRTCTKCGEFRLWEEFHNSNKGLKGRVSRCKECAKKQQEEKRESIVEYYKQWYAENRDVRLEKQKKYRIENREDILEKAKQYYVDNKEAKKEYDKQYREENKTIIIEKKKQYNNSPANYKTFKDKLTSFEDPCESKEGYLEVKCATCRKYFIPTNLQVRSRLRALNGNQSGEHRLYCSDACKEACSVFWQRKYPKGFKKPSNKEYQPEFRQMILERDNYTCQVCNKQFDKKQLHAHHLTPVVCSPMEQVDIDNGICVCKECHINLHLTQEGITYAELSKAGKSKEDKDENED